MEKRTHNMRGYLLYAFILFSLFHASLDNNIIIPFNIIGWGFILFFLFCIVIYCLKKRIIEIDKNMIATIPFLGLLLVHNFLFSYTSTLFEYIVLLGFVYFYEKQYPTKALLKMILYVSMFVSLTSLFGLFFKDAYLGIISKLYSQSVVDWIMYRIKYYGYNPGITVQVSFLAGFGVLGCAIAVIFSLYHENKNGKIMTLLMIAIPLFAVIFSSKRSHLVFLCIALLIAVMNTVETGKKGRIFLRILLIAFVLVGLLIVAMPYLGENNSVVRIIQSISDIKGNEDITSNRSYIYGRAFDMVQGKELFGVGLGNFKLNSGISTDVHNAYIQIYVEMGILGLLTFSIMALSLLIITFDKIKIMKLRSDKTEESMFLCFSLFYQIFFLLYSLTGNTLTDCFYFYLYIIISFRSLFLYKYGNDLPEG